MATRQRHQDRELRAIAGVYASAGGAEQLAADFVDAWTEVMDLDRSDLAATGS